MYKIRIGSIIFCLLLMVAVSAALAADVSEAKIAPWLQARLFEQESVSFIVRFDDADSLRAIRQPAAASGTPGTAVYQALRTRARQSQASARSWLTAQGIPFRPLYIVNALVIEGDLQLARTLASRPEVVALVGNPSVRGVQAFSDPPGPSTDGLEWGVTRIRADEVWSVYGTRGEGIVIASADTGVEWNHPAIRDHYRGWNGSTADHNYSWYDSIEDRAIPIDDHDHGTHTTGTMVGDDGGSNLTGVAPGAKWIGCRNMNAGNGQPSTYIACMEYFLAPWPHGGDPETDGRPEYSPHIINNSWGCPPSEGCDAGTLLDAFRALEDANILAVSSAGNSGPFCSTISDPPAIYAENLIVGATDSSNSLAIYSSKGPVQADGSGRLSPDLAAPGSGVRSSVRGGGYASFSGTSMAGPHVAGAAALLWAAKPQTMHNIELSRCLLSRSAVTMSIPFSQSCGGTRASDRPNNLFGYGLLDARNAIEFGPDGDSDLIADVCDCNAGDGGAFVSAHPVAGVRFDSPEQIGWDGQEISAGTGTTYDISRGNLSALHANGNTTDAGCLDSGMTQASGSDSEVPALGAGYYYIVRASNSCGNGGWGASSAGAIRFGTFFP